MDHKGEKLQHHYCKYGFCFVFFMAATGAAIYGGWIGEGLDESLTRSFLLFLVVFPAMLSMTHQRMNFAYRFSKSGGEFCEWKNFP
ncbi:hypothetical protein ACYTTS_29670, partial [Pseudomonas aeruginosa]